MFYLLSNYYLLIFSPQYSFLLQRTRAEKRHFLTVESTTDWAFHQKSRCSVWIVPFPFEHEIELLTGNRILGACISQAVFHNLYKKLSSTDGSSSVSAVVRETLDGHNVVWYCSSYSKSDHWPAELRWEWAVHLQPRCAVWIVEHVF